MSENKFEQLIELFIAEDEQGAKDLFHEIVVEKSRDIYEGLVDEEQVEETAEVEEDAVEESDEEVSEDEVEESDFDEAELGGDAADDMIDDIEADEEGLSMEADDDMDDDMEDRVVDLEDALDELKAEFEALMAKDGDDDDMDMNMDMDKMDMDKMDMDDDDDDMDKMESEEEVEESDEQIDEGQDLSMAPKPVTGEEASVNKASMKAPKKDSSDADAGNLAQGGEESGGSTPASQDMGGTTAPDMKKV